MVVYKYTRNCVSCSCCFKTNYPQKKYCGASKCEQERRRVKSREVERRRRGKRKEEKAHYYERNRESILKYKRDKYKEKFPSARSGRSTVQLKYEDVKHYFLNRGYSLLSSDYINNRTKLLCRCPEGHEWSVTLHNFKDMGHSCPSCQVKARQSAAEIEIIEYLKSSIPEVEVIEGERGLLCGRELDLYFPVKKVAVEYCGLHWHGELYTGKPRNYHYKKMKDCISSGVRLITIFEDEYLERPDVVLSRIENSLGVIKKRVYARRCSLIEVDYTTASLFLDRYHLQGKSVNKVGWGLLYEGELVQVLTLGSLSRKHAGGDGVIELKRLASKSGISVVGGASKLFCAAKKWSLQRGYRSIKSYCDMRWANPFNSIYEKLGFSLVSETKYTPHYFKGQKRYRNQSLRKTPAERLTGKTEWELRREQGYDRIWDCGHRTYIYDLVKGS